VRDQPILVTGATGSRAAPTARRLLAGAGRPGARPRPGRPGGHRTGPRRRRAVVGDMDDRRAWTGPRAARTGVRVQPAFIAPDFAEPSCSVRNLADAARPADARTSSTPRRQRDRATGIPTGSSSGRSSQHIGSSACRPRCCGGHVHGGSSPTPPTASRASAPVIQPFRRTRRSSSSPSTTSAHSPRWSPAFPALIELAGDELTSTSCSPRSPGRPGREITAHTPRRQAGRRPRLWLQPT